MQRHEFENLKALLAEQDAAILAEFIAEQAGVNEDFCAAAWNLARRSDPEQLTQSLLERIKRVCNDQRFYNWKHLRDLDNHLDNMLDRIERDLLPASPERAIDVLAAFFRTDASVFERADDDGLIAMTYDRAAELFARASALAGKPANAALWFDQLIPEDHYGVRSALLGHAAKIFPNTVLRARIQGGLAELEADDSRNDQAPQSGQPKAPQSGQPNVSCFGDFKGTAKWSAQCFMFRGL